MSRPVLSGVAIGVQATLRAQPPAEIGTVMATVYVVTAETTRANGLTTSPTRSAGRRRLPDDQGSARRTGPEYPGVEVAGLSREKVEEMFSDTIDQVRADLAGLSRN